MDPVFRIIQGTDRKTAAEFFGDRHFIAHHSLPSAKMAGRNPTKSVFFGYPVVAVIQRPSRQEIKGDEMGLLCFYPFHLLLLELVKMIVSA